MLLSVILPNYNDEDWLPHALRALLAQELPPDEIIVVDDGSIDGSRDVVARYQEKYPAIRLLRHDTNCGVAAALNTGLAETRGDFVFCAAADDITFPALFRRAIAALLAHPQAALFCSAAAMINRDHRILGFRPNMPPARQARYLSPDDVRHEIQLGDNWIVGASSVYRRSALSEIGGFDGTLGSLCDGMATRLLSFRHGFYFDPTVLVAYRVNAETLSAKAALSETESQRLMSMAGSWMERNFSAADTGLYRNIFLKRLGFSMSRLQLAWNPPAALPAVITETMGLTWADRIMLRLLLAIPMIGRLLALIWLTVRTRPYPLASVITSWHHKWRRDAARRHETERALSGLRG